MQNRNCIVKQFRFFYLVTINPIAVFLLKNKIMAYVEKVCHIFRYVFISINKTSRLGPLYFAEVGVLMKKINKKIFKRIAVVSAAVAVCAGVVFSSYRYMERDSLPAVGSVQSDKPVIVLDAGHGAYVLNKVC